MTQADPHRATGHARSTVSRSVWVLTEHGLLTETEDGYVRGPLMPEDYVLVNRITDGLTDDARVAHERALYAKRARETEAELRGRLASYRYGRCPRCRARRSATTFEPICLHHRRYADVRAT